MKNLLSLWAFSLFILFPTFAQEEIQNVKTEDHEKVTGAKLFIIPPAGFDKAHQFQGYMQQNSGSSIMVAEIPGPYAKIAASFTKEGLEAEGIMLKKQTDLTLNGAPALLLTTEQFAYGTYFAKYILLFGNEEATVMLNGTYPKELEAIGEQILAALKTIVYDPDLEVDPLEGLPYAIQTEGTKLRFAKNLSGSLIYTTDGRIPTESADKTMFMVAPSFAEIDIIDFKGASLERIKSLPFENIEIAENSITKIEIDGMSGYELVAWGEDPEKASKELLYQVMLFNDKGYYLIFGSTETDYDATLVLFKQVALTLKRK